MEEVRQLFKGVLLTAIGLVIIYESYFYNLLDIIMLIGILMLFIGIIMLVMLFATLNLGSESQILEYTKSSFNQKKNNLQVETKNIASLDNFYHDESIFTNINKQFAERFNNNSKNSKAVLRSNPQSKWYDQEFESEIPEQNLNAQDNISLFPSKIKSDKSGFMSKNQKKITQPYQFNFTPNYEKPMKVTRKPRKREVPIEITQTIEPVPETITPIFAENRENDNSDESEKLSTSEPKVISNVNNKKINDDTHNIIPKTTKSTSLTDFDKDNLNTKKDSLDIDFNTDSQKNKLRSSYVICNNGIMTSQEAFEQLSKHAKSNILMEIPSLRHLNKSFLSNICKLNTKIIIQEFNVKDTSYMLLLSSLMEQNVKIKVLPLVNTFNLISDHSYALIISDGQNQTDFDYGAVFTDFDSIQEIKDAFEKSWNLAYNIEKNLNYKNN
jgi:hypothetical protein